MHPMLAGLRSQAEQIVTSVWREVLGTADLGLDDNIFDRGGNSLHVIQALTTLRDRLDAPLTALDLFQHPTIRSLVHFLYPEPAPLRPWDTATDRAARQRQALEALRNSITNRRDNLHV
jgi:hypothetical protein